MTRRTAKRPAVRVRWEFSDTPYKRPGEKLSLRAMLPLAKGLLGSMTPKALFRFAKIMAKGEPGLDKRFDREKKPYLFVGLACVREPYQGQGYMRRIMDMAFREGDRLGVPVLLETDAKSKCDKYVHPACSLPERAASASTARCTT